MLVRDTVRVRDEGEEWKIRVSAGHIKGATGSFVKNAQGGQMGLQKICLPRTDARCCQHIAQVVARCCMLAAGASSECWEEEADQHAHHQAGKHLARGVAQYLFQLAGAHGVPLHELLGNHIQQLGLQPCVPPHSHRVVHHNHAAGGGAGWQ